MFHQRKSFNSKKDPLKSQNNDIDYLSTIDINDNINAEIEISSTTIKTVEVMKLCRQRIIYPFNIMLMMVGWRPVGSQMYNSECKQKWISILNNCLLIILIFLVIFSYTYQVITCRFIINPKDEIKPIVPPKPTYKPGHTEKWSDLGTSIPFKNTNRTVDCYHRTTTYIIPSIIHFVAYVIGIIHYRFRKNEDIYGLMEKALQYSTSLEQNKKNQYKITTILTIWMAFSVIWVLLSMINHVMYDFAYKTFSNPFYNIGSGKKPFHSSLGTFLFVLDFFGFLIMSIVTTVILLNYLLYCELVKFYIDAISKKIEMRCIKINVIKNDIHIIGIAIDLINSTTGTMATLIYIYNMNLFVAGLNMLLSNNMLNMNVCLKLVFRIYFVLHLIPLIIAPLIQCVRTNKAANCFKDWAMHMSVFGYRKEKKKDLDSFLFYTMGYKSKAKLLFLPLQWAHVCFLCIAVGFIFLCLIQAGILSNLRFIGDL